MISRILHLWERLRTSLWLVPTAMSFAAALLALVAGQLDAAVAAADARLPFLYPGDRAGARVLLSTVAGSMITVAGVTFSVTVVALSLASSQFGPRLLLNFLRDQGNQLVLGTFIATFLFCLLALGQAGADPATVPAVSATVGLLLAIADLAVLIYFIHHVSTSIHAERVVDGVSRELERAVERLFPPEDRHRYKSAGASEPEASKPEASAPDLTGPDASREGPSRARPGAGGDPSRADPRLAEDAAGAGAPDFATAPAVPAPWNGYIQRVDEVRLLDLAVESDRVIRVLRRPGHFVVEGEPLLRVAGAGEVSPELARELQSCFIGGRQRSHEQDPEYAMHQLVEVAVRALSPGVNDPYTALSCVDWLGSVLCKVARRPLRSPRRSGPDGELRLVVDPITFEGLLATAFNQIRQFAQATPSVSMRILESLACVGVHAAGAERRAAVRSQADMVYHGALGQGLQECDRHDLEARYRAVIDAVEGREENAGNQGGEEGAGGEGSEDDAESRDGEGGASGARR